MLEKIFQLDNDVFALLSNNDSQVPSKITKSAGSFADKISFRKI